MEDIKTTSLFLPSSVENNLPLMVRSELSKMPALKQQEFLEEFKRKQKSLGVGYLFLIVIFAAHYAYLNKWILQILFWLTGGGLLLWWFIDIFRLPGLVKNYNMDIATDVMRNLKAISN